MKANLPVENAKEPEEEAHQPLSLIMPPGKIDERKSSNYSFVDEDTPPSSSSYEGILSQPDESLTQRQRLKWLQKRRVHGLWVQCNDCTCWRYLPNVLDKHDLPRKWYCRMNPDSKYASCSSPETPIPIYDEEDLIYSEYSPGSLVVARMNGWPWWPAMVDDCPDTEQYYWLDGLSDIPTNYNVVFFDESEVTRAWLAPSQLKPYKQGKKIVNSLLHSNYRKRLEVAIKQANEAEKLTQIERLAKYSFIARYKGNISSPKQVSQSEIQKYRENFKRKFSVEYPDVSENDNMEENRPITETPTRRNVITLGSKKNKVTKDIDVDSNSYTVNTSLVVQRATNSDLALTADTPEVMLKVLHETADRAGSPGSDDFDF